MMHSRRRTSTARRGSVEGCLRLCTMRITTAPRQYQSHPQRFLPCSQKATTYILWMQGFAMFFVAIVRWLNGATPAPCVRMRRRYARKRAAFDGPSSPDSAIRRAREKMPLAIGPRRKLLVFNDYRKAQSSDFRTNESPVYCNDARNSVTTFLARFIGAPGISLFYVYIYARDSGASAAKSQEVFDVFRPINEAARAVLNCN